MDTARDPHSGDIVAQVVTLAGRLPADGGEAAMSISVGDLGTIALRVSVSGDVVTVTVDSASPAARHMLETAEPRLAQDLSAIGLSLDDRSSGTDGRGDPNRATPHPGPWPPDRTTGRTAAAAPPAETRLVRHVNLLA
jgi:hypothetical protein